MIIGVTSENVLNTSPREKVVDVVEIGPRLPRQYRESDSVRGGSQPFGVESIRDWNHPISSRSAPTRNLKPLDLTVEEMSCLICLPYR